LLRQDLNPDPRIIQWNFLSVVVTESHDAPAKWLFTDIVKEIECDWHVCFGIAAHCVANQDPRVWEIIVKDTGYCDVLIIVKQHSNQNFGLFKLKNQYYEK